MGWTGFDEAWLAARRAKVESRVVRTQPERREVERKEREILAQQIDMVREIVAVVKSAKQAGLPVLVGLCRAAGMEEPVVEYRFHARRRWRFDYAWPSCKLALEVEGGQWVQGRHNRGSGQIADLEKYSEAAILGWRILYCTPSDLATVGLERMQRAFKGGSHGEASEAR